MEAEKRDLFKRIRAGEACRTGGLIVPEAGGCRDSRRGAELTERVPGVQGWGRATCDRTH